MSCSSCGSKTDGVHPGCKSNGSCASGGCDKLPSFNWLGGMGSPDLRNNYDIVEIRFKSGRKTFYRNLHDLPLQIGDVVVTEASPGHDMGIISADGELARIQVEKKSPNTKKFELKKVVRKATAEDIELWMKARGREQETMLRSRAIAREFGLQMKISDVEYQGDNAKATFFYTADERVDFRELIKKLAEEFRIRVEMRQIGARQEAGRLGGIGSCGRELCCSTWLTDFRTVSTSAARYQQLSLNPQKLAGQCGKLKCCLNYELDMYMEAVKTFPDTNIRLESEDGYALHFKTDIFKNIVWYLIPTPNGTTPVPLKLERVLEIIEMNKAGKKPKNFKDYSIVMEPVEKEPDYDNVVGQDSVTRFDDKNKSKKRPGKRRSSNNRNQRKPAGDGVKASGSKSGGTGANTAKAKPSQDRKNSADRTPGEAKKNTRSRNPNARRKGNTRRPNKPGNEAS